MPTPGRFILLIILAAVHTRVGAQGVALTAERQRTSPYWQQQVDYIIDVTLNDVEHTLDGFVRMTYANRSPDTLSFIWIHLWPNSYKNDRTAFSDQLLAHGRTDFYFSDKGKRGYINRLDMRVNGQEAKMEDHPQYIDIIKVILPHPLAPGASATITTPFHEQLPYNFSRGGHVGNTYQVTQWYPKPAVYDSKGWHPMPYLDQGEFYSEFGDYDVRITAPKSYIVAATGQAEPQTDSKDLARTWHFRQNNVHDFAWFADKKLKAETDTIRLPSGKIIDIHAYYRPAPKTKWANTIRYAKEAIRARSAWLGDYPYDMISIVQTFSASPGGMEYPTITSITDQPTAMSLDLIIAHEIGHNWFYGALATNERRWPWMDEGMNTFYDNRYAALRYPHWRPNTPEPRNTKTAKESWLSKKMPEDQDKVFLNTLASQHADQPISTASEDFTQANYQLVAYSKTARWMNVLEDSLGRTLFDSVMRSYHAQWRFRHPQPGDFRAVVTNTSGKELGSLFAQLDTKGPLPPMQEPRKIRPTFLFNFRNTDKIDYINIIPAIIYDKYDGAMLGTVIHNYNLPFDKLQLLAAPLYATGSKDLEGIAGIHYNWYPDSRIKKITAGIWGEKFSSLSAVDSNDKKLYGGYYKLTPSIKIDLRQHDYRSSQEAFAEWKTFLIGERSPNKYVIKSTDSMAYPEGLGKYNFRYLNQLTFQAGDKRVLYPWQARVQLQQAARFYRVNFAGKYYFNYAAGGGLDLRLFAAKFGYLGGSDNGLYTSRFQPKLTGVSGPEDYTYGNFFLGRNEYTGFASQQIMQRDGNLKIRVPTFPWLEGRSDDWVSSLNLTTTLPQGICPKWLPLRLYFDVGTYSGAWHPDALTGRFLYVGGLQLSLFHNVINFYAPVFYSREFRENLRTLPDQNTFFKRLSFSIDLQNLDLRKILGNMPN